MERIDRIMQNNGLGDVVLKHNHDNFGQESKTQQMHDSAVRIERLFSQDKNADQTP